MARILSGNQTKGAPGFKTRWTKGPRIGSRANVTRLASGMLDPNDGVVNSIGPDVAIGANNPQNNNLVGSRPTVMGANGGSQGLTAKIKGTSFGNGRSVIKNRGVNRSIKKR